MGDDEKINIGRNAENLQHNPDMASKTKAERAASLFPRLRGPVDEAGNPSASGGSQAAGAEKGKELPTGDDLVKKYGESSGDPAHTTFVLKDGRGVANTGADHDTMLGGRATDKNPPREKFVADGNIRVRPRTGAGREVSLSIPESGINTKQLTYLQKMASQLKSGAVLLEVGKPGGEYRILSHGEATPEALEKSLKELAPIHEMPSQATAHNVNGGSTFHPTKGDLNGTKHFAVGGEPEFKNPDLKMVTDGKELTPAQIDEFSKRAAVKAALEKHKDASVGTWYDKDTGKTTTELVKTPTNKAEAIKMGTKNGEKAIYDLANGKEIKTGGTGEAKEWAPPKDLEKGIPHDEPVHTEIPLDKISVSKQALDAALDNAASGRGTKTKGPVSVFYNTDNGQFLIEDGMHRIAEAHSKGKTSIPATLWSGYSDTIANVRPEDRAELGTAKAKEALPKLAEEHGTSFDPNRFHTTTTDVMEQPGKKKSPLKKM
jgi:hypothetical protein